MSTYTSIERVPETTSRKNILSFSRSYLIHMRPYLLFISGVAGAAGMVLNNGRHNIPELIIAFLPLFLGYGFGQALTDCFQTDTDSISAPYRPLSKGTISRKQVLIVSIAGLSLSAFIYLIYNPYSFWICLLIIFGLSTYSYVKKNITLLAPFYNAWVVGLLPLLAYYITSETEWGGIPSSTWKIAALSFFSYSNFVLVGYLKDVEADAATGYKTFPVVYGWEMTLRLAWVIAIATFAAFIATMPENGIAMIVGFAACIILVYGLLYAKFLEVQNEQTALIPIISTVRSFILLHLAVLVDHETELIPAAILFYLAFEIVLRKRPSKYQV
jgi:geranylgeranylglycerol-phosphate geranylgeranyltransferase